MSWSYAQGSFGIQLKCSDPQLEVFLPDKPYFDLSEDELTLNWMGPELNAYFLNKPTESGSRLRIENRYFQIRVQIPQDVAVWLWAEMLKRVDDNKPLD